MSSFQSVANQYVAWDPNESTKAELQRIIDANTPESNAQLESLLSKRIAFGTAGLRGPMGVGYSRMNELVVLQTMQGLVRYLQAQLGKEEVARRGIVIGYDHRKYQNLTSASFAYISAAVLIHEGVKVYMLENNSATPFVAYGVLNLNCCAGIMVTASHNPKRDDGYKVYWGNGSQIIPPHDAGIAAAIDENLAPWAKYDYSAASVYSHPKEKVEDVTETLASSYFASLSKMCLRRRENALSTARIAYTAMHGVGYQWCVRAFEAFGHQPFFAVPSQRDADPEFPTVAFPNPEEKGALNESIKFANANNCSIIIANDPDADRLGIAERKAGTDEWVILTGNEIGALLGHYQIMKWKKQAEMDLRKHGTSLTQAAVCASVVSSRMLKKIATSEGVQYHDTLTGFKWLGNRAIELKARGVDVLFCYEEALGFCVGDTVHDKDGLSAAAVFTEMVVELAEANNGCVDNVVQSRLKSLYNTYGEFVSYNSYVISHDSKVTDAIFARLRTSGGNTGVTGTAGYWTECAGVQITSIKDITVGHDSTNSAPGDRLPTTPDSHMIMMEFANGCSVTLRTSGTEPKIKFYTEIAGAVGANQDRETIKATLHTFIDNLVNEMLQPDVHGLARA